MHHRLLSAARSEPIAVPFAKFRRHFLAIFLVFACAGAFAQSDTLTAGVAAYPGPKNKMLAGATHDLALLEVRTLTIKSAISISAHPDTADELLIVREGELDLTKGDSSSTVGPGGVALIPAGTSYSLEAKQSTYYRFRFRSRAAKPADATEAGKALFVVRWADIPVRQTAKGETRPIFSRPTTWLAKIDLHATTLNPGEVSHPPHIHRAEEIILMRSGNVQLYINGNHYPTRWKTAAPNAANTSRYNGSSNPKPAEFVILQS